MILLTAGLQNIPEDVYESASIDGANTIQRFFRITMPMLRPAIMSVLILGVIYTFKVDVYKRQYLYHRAHPIISRYRTTLRSIYPPDR